MKSVNKTRILLSSMVALITTPFITTPVSATPLAEWNNPINGNPWTQIADDDGVWSNGYVGPGYGGQAFDTEYLYYSASGTKLSIGLQTGFDIENGFVDYSGHRYYSGDLALSFDGDSSYYEFGVDFGFYTKDYYGHKVNTHEGSLGVDPIGIYENAVWNNGVYTGYGVSNPFALDEGDLLSADFSSSSGHGTAGGKTSYYQIVTFDLVSLGLDLSNPLNLDAHWTMSCGNDNINGHDTFSVPEPGILALLATGLIGTLAATSRKRKNSA